MEKITSISKMIGKAKGKYEAEKKENKALSETVTAYTDEADFIIEKINAKYIKEKSISLLEREIQQLLTKLKFKTFSYTIKQ
jgi:predicted RNase H-like nuclease (RuvC/YqgF family)